MEEPPKKVIIITGAAGFIGMNLTLRLLRQDTRNKIYAIDNLITSKSPYTHASCCAFLKEKTASGHYVFLEEDVTQLSRSSIPENHIDEIYHLASIAFPPNIANIPC